MLFIFYHRQMPYDWWFFPFQLCSLPMYLCLLLPFLKHKSMKTAVCTFLQDFNLLGGLAALIVSEGFRGIHWTLTLHRVYLASAPGLHRTVCFCRQTFRFMPEGVSADTPSVPGQLFHCFFHQHPCTGTWTGRYVLHFALLPQYPAGFP